MGNKTRNKEIHTVNHLILFVLGMFVLGIVFGIVISSNSEADLYKTILMVDNHWSGISLDSQQALYYYELAGYDYEDGDYKSAERNCRLARDYFLEESQGYRKIKAELEASNIEDNLIDIYIEITNERIITAESLFEACEHFESASRYYDKYYSDITWDDKDYEMGGKQIEAMNDKISEHDDAIRRYNSLLEDFGVELEKRI